MRNHRQPIIVEADPPIWQQILNIVHKLHRNINKEIKQKVEDAQLRQKWQQQEAHVKECLKEEVEEAHH